MTKYEEIKEAASKTPPLKQSSDTKEKKEEEELIRVLQKLVLSYLWIIAMTKHQEIKEAAS